MSEIKLWKKVGDEIIIAEVDDGYCPTTCLSLLSDSSLMVRAEIIGIRKAKGENYPMMVCRAKYTMKWTGLRYKVKENAMMTVFPTLGKAIIWDGGMIDMSYGAGRKTIYGDMEIGIVRADGQPKKQGGRNVRVDF